MTGLSEFHDAVRDPAACARETKESGRKVIGYFCTYTPEELISAAGAHPMRLFGSKGEISLADAHLQSYACSLVRSVLEEALAGRLDFLDGAVFPHTCDSIQRLSDIWRLNVSQGFFADVVLPVKLNTDSAREYMRAVLEKFRRELEAGLGVTIDEKALGEALALTDRIRGLLKKIYEMRSDDPGLLPGRDLAALVKGSMIMDRNRAADGLEKVIEEMKAGLHAWDASGAKRLILSGGVCDHPEIYEILESSGAAVVWDDLCTGSRWFEGLTKEGDPLTALADRYLDRPICPAKHLSNTARADHLAALARARRADGAIFLLLKFCDPHAFDYPHLKERLDRENLPNMLFEIEDQLPSAGQLQTRFETFIQML